MTVRVIALDPGGTTGWASYTDALGDFTWSGGQLGPNEHHGALFALLENQAVQDYTVVCESFEFRQGRQRNNIDLSSKEYIGVAKLFRDERGVPLVMQTAATAKSFVTDQKIRSMGLWMPGMKHQMDAVRHLVTFLVTKKKMTHLVDSWKDLV